MIAGAKQKLPVQDDGAVVQHVVEEGEKFTCEETGREERRWTNECDVKESPGEYVPVSWTLLYGWLAQFDVSLSVREDMDV